MSDFEKDVLDQEMIEEDEFEQEERRTDNSEDGYDWDDDLTAGTEPEDDSDEGSSSGIWKALIIACAVIFAAAAVYRIFNSTDEVITKPLSTVSVSHPMRKDINVETSLVGTVTPGDINFVIPKVVGEIIEVYVSTGDEVQVGDPICRVDNQKQIDAARIQLDGAQVQVDTYTDAVALARTNLDRMATLYASGDISASAYEQTKSGYDQAVAGLEGAKLSLEGAKLSYDTQVEFATITAPIAGKIESTNMELHNYATQQAQVAVITGTGGNQVSFSVTDRLLPSVKAGDPIRAEKQGLVYEGIITSVDRFPSLTTGLYEVKASLEGAEAIQSGASVKVYFTESKARYVLCVDTDAVYYDGGKSYIYTLTYGSDENLAEDRIIADGNSIGTVHKNEVVLGISDDEVVQIISGVTRQDLIINSWTAQLFEGAVVQVLPEEEVK